MWTEEATAALQDCFDTEKEILAEGTDLEGYTSAVLSLIIFCTGSVTTTQTIKVFWFGPWPRGVCPAQSSWCDLQDRRSTGLQRRMLVPAKRNKKGQKQTQTAHRVTL